MGDENSRFFQNGSQKNFDFRQICFDLVHFMIPIGSGQKCLTYDPAIAKARRGNAFCQTQHKRQKLWKSHLSNYSIIRVTLNTELATADIRRQPAKMAWP